MVEESLFARADWVRKPLRIHRGKQRSHRTVLHTWPLRSNLGSGVASRDQPEGGRPLALGPSRNILPRHERVRFGNQRIERNTRSSLARDGNVARGRSANRFTTGCAVAAIRWPFAGQFEEWTTLVGPIGVSALGHGHRHLNSIVGLLSRGVVGTV